MPCAVVSDRALKPLLEKELLGKEIERIQLARRYTRLEEKTADGQIRRWAVEGPSVIQLRRRSMENLVKVGEVIEVCGYGPKEATVWQIASPDGATSLAGRLLTAELIVLPDGRVQSWGDYGFHHCFPPGYTDAHSR